MNRLKSVGELIRIGDVVLIAGAVVMGGYLAAGSFSLRLLIAASSAASVAAGGYAINDWRDEKIDQINKPQRPIPAGRLSKPQALVISVILQFIGLSLSLFLNQTAVTLVLLWLGLVNLYSLKLKKIPLVGNLTTAFLLATTFVFGELTVGRVEAGWLLAIVIFLANLSREMIKDIEDIPGDQVHQVQTLAGLIGPAKTSLLAAGLFILAIALLLDHRITGLFNGIYFWLIWLVVGPMTLILAIRCIKTKGACATWARTWSKAIFGVMLVAVGCGLINDIH